MKRPLITLALATLPALPLAAWAQTSLGLQNYGLVGNFAVPTLGGPGLELSAVTYAPDRGTLFVVGDEGLAVVELSLTGTVVGSMAFNWAGTGSSNNDAEGLAYLGGGRLVVVDERPQIAYSFTYANGGTVALSAQPQAPVGSTSGSVGNVGTEGISWDPRDGSFVSVKQDNPMELRAGSLNFAVGGGTSTMTTLFTGPASLFGVNNFADVQTLSPVAALAGTPAANNLLILSLDSRRLIEVDRASGLVISSLDLAGFTAQAIEGVTVDTLGNIYLVAEDSGTPNSRLFVLSAVPEPASGALLLAGVALLGWRWRQAR
jgi:uncharacterized protein YjiK